MLLENFNKSKALRAPGTLLLRAPGTLLLEITDLGISEEFIAYINPTNDKILFCPEEGKAFLQNRSLKDWNLNWIKKTPADAFLLPSRLSRNDFNQKDVVPISIESDDSLFFYKINSKNGNVIESDHSSLSRVTCLKEKLFSNLSFKSNINYLFDIKTKEKLLETHNPRLYAGRPCNDLLFIYPIESGVKKECTLVKYENLTLSKIDVSSILKENEGFHRNFSSKNNNVILGVKKTGSIDEVYLNSYRYYIFTSEGDIFPVGDLDMSLYYNFISPDGQDEFFDVYVGKDSDLEFRRYSEKGELLHTVPIKLPKLNKHGYYSLYDYFVETIQVGNHYVTVDPKVNQVFVFNKETFEHEFVPIKDFFQTTKKPAFVEFNNNSGMPYGDNYVVYQKKKRGAWCLAYISFDGEVPAEVQHLKECCEKAKDEELPEVSTEFPW